MRAKTISKVISAVLSASMLMTLIPAASVAAPVEATGAEENLLKLWYDKPASRGTNILSAGAGRTEEDNRWQQQTLPIGNSFMGANIYGEVGEEWLTFNQKTLWNGGPSTKRPNYNGGNKENMVSVYQNIVQKFKEGKDAEASNLCGSLTGLSDGYGAYQAWGNIYLKYNGLPGSEQTTNYSDYERNLDLSEGVANVDFTVGGTKYHREYFVSYPDNVLAMKLTAEGGSKMNINVCFPIDNGEESEIKSVKNGGNGKEVTYTTEASGNAGTIVTSGEMQDNQMKLNSILKVETKDGTVEKGEDRTFGTDATVNEKTKTLDVKGASEVIIYIAADTDYLNDYPVYRTGETDAQLAESVKAVLDAAVEKGYDEVKASHLADYKELYGRVDLDLGQAASDKPTDALLKAYKDKTASVSEQRLLEVILYQYGRYLTIASSREGDLPSNLQGVWQNCAGPTGRIAWASDYHMNVNLQMNYWPTYSANLAECATPLIEYVDSLREPGRVTAEKYFGIKSEEGEENGFSAHTQNTPFGWTCPGWSFSWGWSPAAVPWILQNCWEHYEYTGDLEYMREHIYPMLREEAILYDQILIDSGKEIMLEDGTMSTRLVSAPAYSPEHGPYTMGNVYEQVLIWQLYEDAATAAELLGVDATLAANWKKNQSRLAPIEIGDSGQLKEWFHETTLGSVGAKGHRHMSHLLGMFPGDLVSVENESYMDAAIMCLEDRGYTSTGWGMGQRINSWARTGRGNTAHLLIQNLFRDGIYPNLWDAHAPFQIDGNFGYTAGVNEMLMQSNVGYINILPALPDVWASGSVNGIITRGNFELDMEWAEGKVTNISLLSNNGGECVVQAAGIKADAVTVKDSKGAAVSVTKNAEKERITFATTKGETYTIEGFGEAEEKEERPNAPTNVKAEEGDAAVTITWNAVPEADSYNVYRRIGADYVKINGNAVMKSPYMDADGVGLDEAAKYRVTAVKNGVESKQSNIATADRSKLDRSITITYDSEKEAVGSLPVDATAKSGTTVTLAECDAVLPGYQFVGWSDGKSTYAGGSEYVAPYRNITLTAVWEPAIGWVKLLKNKWSAVAGSEEGKGNDGPASAAIDDDEGTKWHSNYSGASDRQPVIGETGERNEFTIDFGETVSIGRFEYVPQASAVNGTITGYQLYYSETEDGDDFKLIEKGTWANNKEKKTVEFSGSISMRRIQLRATATAGNPNNKYIHAAEFNVYSMNEDESVVMPEEVVVDETMTLIQGESGQLQASVLPVEATYHELTYESSDRQVATVSEDGVVTASAYKTGMAEITVTAIGGKSSVCAVTVAQADYVPVESIELNRTSLSMRPGDTITLEAVVKPDTATNQTVKWETENASVANVSSGQVTAVGVGATTITATAFGGKEDSCVVRVSEGGQVNADELIRQVNEAKKIDTSIYSGEAKVKFEAALQHAIDTMKDMEATQDEIDEALRQLKEAQKQMEDSVAPPVTPETPDQPGPGPEKPGGTPDPGTPDPGTPAPGTPDVPQIQPTFEVGDLKYRVISADAANASAAVAGFSSAGAKKTKVVISPTVAGQGITFKVTAIDAKAFEKNKKLKSVTIGSNVTTIGGSAFAKCSKLSSIRFMGLKAPKIGSGAFKGIKSKCKVYYPKKMKKKDLNALKKGMKTGKAKKAVYKKK